MFIGRVRDSSGSTIPAGDLNGEKRNSLYYLMATGKKTVVFIKIVFLRKILAPTIGTLATEVYRRKSKQT